MVTTQGFITIGRTELLLALISVALMMAILGYALGQVIMMIRRPAVVKPQECTLLHCDHGPDMSRWLGQHDFSLITNEMLHDLETRVLPRALIVTPGPEWPTAEAIEAVFASGKHRKADS